MGADAAEAGRERALESIRIVRITERLEIADQEANDLVARGCAPAAHLIRKVEGAQSFLERPSECGRAAEDDREIAESQLRPLGQQPLDLSRTKERLVDRIGLPRNDHRGAHSRCDGPQLSALPPRLGRREDSLARIQGRLRAPAALVETQRRGAVRGDEVMTEQPRHRAAKTVDRLVRVADDDQPGTGLGGSDQTQELELGRVDVLELVDEDEAELSAEPFAKRRARLQQLDRPGDQVAEIDEARRLQAALVLLVNAGKHAQTLTGACLRREL